MAISPVAVGQKITAAIVNALIKQVNATALSGIIPASVAGTGVTLQPNGAISFVNATNVSVNGVFSGSYDNYRITWNSPTRSASGSTQFRLRGGGADITTASYDWTKTVASGTTTTTTSSSSSTALPLDQGQAAGQTSDGVIDLYGPALAQYTAATVQSTVLASSALYGSVVNFANETAASYDGFSLYPLTAGETWSGTVRIYGYNTLT